MDICGLFSEDEIIFVLGFGKNFIREWNEIAVVTYDSRSCAWFLASVDTVWHLLDNRLDGVFVADLLLVIAMNYLQSCAIGICNLLDNLEKSQKLYPW